MPPRKRVGAGARRGKWAGTAFERPLDAKPVYPDARRLLEGNWDSKVAKHAKAVGVLSYHTHNSERSEAGFPDRVFVGDRGLMFRELKLDDTGVVSDEQAKWILFLRKIGIDADIWWVGRDWNSGRIQNDINALGRRGPASVDVTSELGQLMYLASVPPAEVAGAAFLWDAGVKVNREWWRKEAGLVMHRAMLHLPAGGGDELAAWLRTHRLPANATPEQVLAAVRATLLRHEPLNGEVAA